MPRLTKLFLAVLLFSGWGNFASAQTTAPIQPKSPLQPAKQDKTAVAAVVESSLKTAGKQIRMLAFDGKADTYFASEKNPTKGDHFTLAFDNPVIVKSITVTTGKPNGGGDALDKGVLEISADGKTFAEAAKFAKGIANVKPGKSIQAIRVKPSEDMTHPLAIREFVVESDPAVIVFKYPVEYTLIVTDAPELKVWGEKVIKICEREYQAMCYDLRSEGFNPTQQVTLTLRNTSGVASASGNRITGSVAYYKRNPDDIGSMVHETVHVVQSYRGNRTPGWLVEGIADYYRNFKYEPGKLPRLTPERARYDGSYKTTAAFLGFVSEKYDKEFVRKMNAICREGKYNPDVWKELTSKTVEELGQEWKASLAR